MQYKLLAVFVALLLGFMSFCSNVFASVIVPADIHEEPQVYYESHEIGGVGFYYINNYKPVTSSTDGIKEYICYPSTTVNSKVFGVSYGGSVYSVRLGTTFPIIDNSTTITIGTCLSKAVMGSSIWNIQYSLTGLDSPNIGKTVTGNIVTTNIPEFVSYADARAYFVDGDTSKCINYDDVSSSFSNVFDSTLPSIDNLRWTVDAEAWRTNPYVITSTSQYSDYGYIDWDVVNPNNYDLDYDIETMVDGIYNVFTSGTEVGNNSSLFHTEWYKIYSKNSKTSPYNFLNIPLKRYSTSMSFVESVTTPYLDKNNVIMSGINLQGMRYSNVRFRVRVKYKTSLNFFSVGDWSVASYNFSTNTFSVANTGNTDAVTSGNITGTGSANASGNTWIDDTNAKYNIDNATMDTTGIIGFIKSGFGLVGSGGLIAFFTALFPFFPPEFTIMILCGTGIMILIALFRAIRG